MENLKSKYPHLSSLSIEKKDKRTLNSKTVINPDETFTLLAHVGHIHYKDKQTRKFEDVDCSFTPTEYGWEMRKNNYELEIPTRSDDWFKFINTVQVDPRTGEDWDKPDEEVSIKPLGITSVEGKLISKPEWKGKGIVLYKDAYGAGVDLEVMVRNTGFVKEVILNEKPADLSKDLEFSFEVAVDGFEIKPKKKDFGQLRGQKKAALKKLKNDKSKRKEEERWEDELEREVWSKESPLVTSNSIILKRLRKTWFKKFNLIDAEGNQGVVKVRLETVNGKTILTKILDRRFLETAVYPVRTDTTTDYYVGAGDGTVYYYETSGQPSQARWDTAHDAAEGAGAPDAADEANARIDIFGADDAINMYRAFYPVDTSGLGATAIISSAILKLRGRNISDDYNGDGYDYVAVVKTFQASNSELVVADYEDCGYDAGSEQGGRAKYLAVKGSADIDISGLTVAGYNDFDLNETGLGWISKTGYTLLGLREGHDIEDNFPGDPGENNKISRLRTYASEATNTSLDPYLAVTYTAPEDWVKELPDSISIAEGLVSEVTKVLSDSISIAETLANQTTLGLSDALSIIESLVSTEVAKRSLSDSIGITEALVNSLGVPLADSLSIAESELTSPDKIISDEITFSESLVIGIVLVLTDALSIAETLANQSTLGLADSISFSESLAAANTFERGLPDSLSIAEALVKSLGVPALTDSISFAEALITTSGKNLSDEITFAEGVSGIDVVLALLDSLSIAESVANQTTISLVETVGLADGYPVRSSVSALSDSQSIAESLATEIGTQKDLDDSISIAESSYRAITVNLSDSLPISEGAAAVNTFERSPTETVSIAESVGNGVTLSLADSLEITEAEVEFTTPALTDSISITESSYRSTGKKITDALSLAEGAAKAVVVNLTESLIIAESLANVTNLGLSDSIGIAESSARVVTFERTVQDSLSIAEAKEKTVSLAKTDSIGIAEAVVLGENKGLADSIGLAESMIRGPVKGLSDTLNIAESLANVTTLGLSDSITIMEGLSLTKEFYLALDDSLSLAEALAKDIVVGLTDTLAIAETLANETTLNLADSIAIGESETETVGGGLADSLSISEEITKFAVGKAILDSISITESLIGAEVYKRALSDTVSIAEALSNVATLGISDSVSIAESSIRGIVLALSDLISITEALIPVQAYERELADSLGIAETLANATTLNVSDSITFEEEMAKVLTLALEDSVEITETRTTDRVISTRLTRRQFLRSNLEGTI